MKPKFKKAEEPRLVFSEIPHQKMFNIIYFEYYEEITLEMTRSWIEYEGFAEDIKIKVNGEQQKIEEDRLVRGEFQISNPEALSFLENFLCERFDVEYLYKNQ